MKKLVAPFIGIAAVGLVLSLFVHVTALFGLSNGLGGAAWGLHIGIFMVWIPAVFAAIRLTRSARQRDFWKVALRGCPSWMR
jgi:hypothetical protein